MSEIKVNKISPKQTCTQVTLGDSGDDIIVASGVNFKTPSVKDASGNIIISRCGSNITIGSSGAAVALAAGATQSGFGASGAVSWNTTKITADPNPAVSGVGYFADTTSSAFTVTLPASPSAGDIVALSDYTGTWATNNLTVGRNLSNINGAAADLVFNLNNTTATLIYVDGTEGWRVIDTGSLSELNNAEYIVATGGTVTCCGDYKIHTFTGPGTFTVTSVGNPIGSDSVDYLVVAGGGGSGGMTPNCNGGGGGGGAGGYRESSGAASGCYSVSPLGSGVSALPVAAQAYPITVGSGGAGKSSNNCVGGSGNNSVFSTITSAGGGGGGTGNCGTSANDGTAGGSGGGGGSASAPNPASGGTGNTPPVAPPQGNPGGNGQTVPYAAGGGGGATQAGVSGTPTGPNAQSGPGGNGATTSISGSSTSYAGGGGGGGRTPSGAGGVLFGLGGTGGGGRGQGPDDGGLAGATNTGGGAGGGVPSATPGIPNAGSGYNGGSGIVIIRYKFQ